MQGCNYLSKRYARRNPSHELYNDIRGSLAVATTPSTVDTPTNVPSPGGLLITVPTNISMESTGTVAWSNDASSIDTSWDPYAYK